MRLTIAIVALLAVGTLAATVSGPGRVRRMAAPVAATSTIWNQAHCIAAYDFTASGSYVDITGNGYDLTAYTGTPVYQNGGLWFTNAPYLRSTKSIAGMASNMSLLVKCKTDLLSTMCAGAVGADNKNYGSIFGWVSGYDFRTRGYNNNSAQWDLWTDTGSAAKSNTLAWVAVTWTNNLVKNYLATGTVDRARLWMTDTSSSMTFTNATIWVGCESGPAYPMRGYIYKVRVYDYALSSNDVTQAAMPDM